MSEEITVGLTDGREVTVDELTVLDRDNGAWIRCVRSEPSRRMEFDETTTYYHLEHDVDYVVADGTDDREVHDIVDRRPHLAATPTDTARR
ncbi:hypothetical protein [Natronococcus sp.]|uniref:hypothetical protein n=1 Tax=Natronococcus sp. TaxID=35747 RepID=UPI0025CC8215|nr:hypothetical protein [Natronococcus sp.]